MKYEDIQCFYVAANPLRQCFTQQCPLSSQRHPRSRTATTTTATRSIAIEALSHIASHQMELQRIDCDWTILSQYSNTPMHPSPRRCRCQTSRKIHASNTPQDICMIPMILGKPAAIGDLKVMHIQPLLHRKRSSTLATYHQIPPSQLTLSHPPTMKLHSR